MDIKLDILAGDIAFTNSLADIVIDKTDEVQQRLYIRLRTFLGEWFINPEYGVPYFQQILGKGRKKATIDNIMQSQILADEGVLELVEFNSTISKDRIYSIDFKVKLTGSAVVTPVSIQIEV
jgi:phage baseplate assembly protein W